MQEHFEKEKEQELIKKCQRGDIKAFDLFIEKYKIRIFYLTYKIIKDRELAEDITQEAFVHAFQHIKDFRGEARLYTWLYRIASNLALNHLKKSQRFKKKELKEDYLSFQQSQKAMRRLTRFLPLELIDSEDVKNILEDGISSLSPKHQEVFILYVLKRLSQKKIAKILDIHPGTVSSRLYYARKSLLSYFKNK